MRKISLLGLFLCSSQFIFSQTFFKDVLKVNRDKLYRNLVNNSITRNLSVALTDSTEENWADAFQAMELIGYSSPWVQGRILLAADNINSRSHPFQRAFLELVYGSYPAQFYNPVKFLFLETREPEIFGLCAEYMFAAHNNVNEAAFLAVKTRQMLEDHMSDPVLSELLYQLEHLDNKNLFPDFTALLDKSWLPGRTLVLSFQSKNRDLPGLILVRKKDGTFLKNADSSYFSVTQLARSYSNLPSWFTNGNTPEGIYRMDGFAKSGSNFIGPTTNIQLTMPFEAGAAHFYEDSTLADSTWELERYKALLPADLKNYYPLLGTFYAGMAGRSEIIAHGTTLSPSYYLNKPYYPISPTQGCLCTKESWDENTGRLDFSDQQKLVDAVTTAGGAKGYLIVININDGKRPVQLEDLQALLKKAGQ